MFRLLEARPKVPSSSTAWTMCNCGSTKRYTSQCKRPIKPKTKAVEYDEDSAWQEPIEWNESSLSANWEIEEHEASKGKKGKGKRSKAKGKSKGKRTPRSITPRPAQNQNAQSDRPQPKPKPEARSRMPDRDLFAMMSTKSKPTWRHTTWDANDYMVCTLAELQGKWQVHQYRKITLYGHDAKNMKQFTLQFQGIARHDALDRPWFGEVWFPVWDAHYAQTQDNIVDLQDLDMEPGHPEPEVCFSRSQVRGPAYALLDTLSPPNPIIKKNRF